MGKTMIVVGAALMLWAGLAQGNPPEVRWTRNYGGEMSDVARKVMPTADGGYVIAGSTGSFGAGNIDYWLVKLNGEGDSLWSRCYSGGGGEVCYAAAPTSDGGFALAGTQAGGFGMVRVDGDGNEIWSHGYASGYCYAVQQTRDGGFILAGTTYLPDETSAYQLVKTDSSGNALWRRVYGGISSDECYAAIETSDGGIAMAGSSTSFGMDHDVWLLKLNADGDSLWARNYVAAGEDYCYSIIETFDGGLALGGQSDPRRTGQNNATLIRVTADGDLIQAKSYGILNLQESCSSLIQMPDSGFVLGGLFSSSLIVHPDMLLVRFDAAGDTLWSSHYGARNGSESCLSVALTSDGGLILAGVTTSIGSGYEDAWVVRLEPEPTNGAPIIPVAVPSLFSLAAPYPNPFNGAVNVKFQTARPGYYALALIDPSGRSVGKLFEGFVPAGERRIVWDAQGAAAGRYWVRMLSEFGEVQSEPITLVK